MTVRANKFTPEVLLSAPRRSAATPNPAGTLALFTVSTYSFQSHSKTSEIRVLDIKTGQSQLLSSDLNATEPTWLLEKNLVLWLTGGEKGKTNLVLADAENLAQRYAFLDFTLIELEAECKQARDNRNVRWASLQSESHSTRLRHYSPRCHRTGLSIGGIIQLREYQETTINREGVFESVRETLGCIRVRMYEQHLVHYAQKVARDTGHESGTFDKCAERSLSRTGIPGAHFRRARRFRHQQKWSCLRCQRPEA